MHSKRKKHVPQRTCVVCRTTQSKRTLTRVIRTPNGVQVDEGGKQAGRGAYLCHDPACWEKAARSRILDQALRTQLTADERMMIAAYGTQNVSQVNDNSK